jgi:tRNA (uracil-5-)-methyltransferase TRM9
MGLTSTGTSTSTDIDNPTKETKEEKERVQDVLVPWVYQAPPSQPSPIPVSRTKPSSNSSVPRSDATKRNEGDEVKIAAAKPVGDEGAGEEGGGEAGPKVFHRYYHLFVAGELRKLVEDAGREEGLNVIHQGGQDNKIDENIEADIGEQDRWMSVVGEGWEADNWWLEGEVGIGFPR